jgi:hypothetical protein
MKIRRHIGKRRRREAKRLADSCSAKYLCAEDRTEVTNFARHLKLVFKYQGTLGVCQASVLAQARVR